MEETNRLQNLIRDGKPCAELPAITPRQSRMLEVLRKGTIDDLAEELYEMAAEDHEKSKNPGLFSTQDQRTGVSSMSKIIVEDGEGERELVSLLHTIHRTILESIILNTIGYQYTTDPGFKQLLYPNDNCAGAYITTFVVQGKDHGKSLSGIQWRKLCNMMNDYVSGADHYQAAKIDCAFRRCNENFEDVERAAAAGERAIKPAGVKDFSDLLRNRICEHDLHDRKVVQIQAPIYVGCSQTIAKRLECHEPLTKLHGSSSCWSLLLSCLKIMDFSFEVVKTPIIKVWQNGQLDIAEILLTMLAGSLTIDGGLNSIQPGTNKGHIDPGKSEAAMLQIYCDMPWLKANLAESEEAIQRRHETLKTIVSFQSGTSELHTTMEKTRESIADSKAEIPKLLVDLDAYEEKQKEELAELRRIRDKQDKENQKMQEWLDVNEMIEDWVKGSGGS